MFQVKEHSGYDKANIPAQTLNGDMPVIDLSRGGLKSAFAAFASKDASKDKSSPEKTPAKLADAAPRTEKEKSAPEQPDQDEQENKNAAASQPDQESAPKEPAKLEKTGYTPPEAFAPKMAAGALSMVQMKAAQLPKASYEDPAHETDADVFNLGKRSNKRVQKEIQEEAENNYSSSTKQSDRLMQDYSQWQQQQAFSRTTEYAVATSTTQQALSDLRAKIDQARKEYEALEQQKAQNEAEVAAAAEAVETTGAAVEAQDAHVAGVAETMVVQEQHDKNVEAANEAEVDLTQAQNMRQEVVDSTIQATFNGDDTYYELKENGVDVAYKVGPDGIAHKMDPQDIPAEARCQMPVPLSVETGAGGKRTIVGAYDQTLPPEQAEKVKKFVDSQNKDITDLPDRNDMANADMNVAYRRDRAIEAYDSAAITETQLKEAQIKYNIPDAAMKDIQSLSAYHDDQLKKAAALHADHDAAIKAYDERLAEGGAIDKAMEAKKAEIATMEKDAVEFKKFEERLANKEFTSEKEMLDAMPDSLKEKYKQNMALQTAPAPVAQQTPSTDNTSRANGSAAPSGIATSANMSDQFGAAAAGTTAPTNEPAPSANEEMVYANTTYKPTASGMHV